MNNIIIGKFFFFSWVLGCHLLEFNILLSLNMGTDPKSLSVYNILQNLYLKVKTAMLMSPYFCLCLDALNDCLIK